MQSILRMTIFTTQLLMHDYLNLRGGNIRPTSVAPTEIFRSLISYLLPNITSRWG